jgi:hypothetical protein
MAAVVTTGYAELVLYPPAPPPPPPFNPAPPPPATIKYSTVVGAVFGAALGNQFFTAAVVLEG